MKQKLVAICLYLSIVSLIHGHDVPVHKAITKGAVAASTGFSRYLKDNNLQFAVFNAGLQNGVWTAYTASGEIILGSANEDDQNDQDIEGGGSDIGEARSLNHFYDPTTKLGLNAKIGSLHFAGLPSPLWATTYNIVDPFKYGGMNVYSWQNARAYQSNSIVNVSAAARISQAGLMFRSVGQVMHLLEDASQPQHVRNEQHKDTWPFLPIDVNTQWRSKIEDFGRENLSSLQAMGCFAPQNLDWMAAGFICVTNFWDRGLYNASSPTPLEANETGGKTLGLAEWCNGNFLTVRGSYAEYPLLAVHGGTTYPYPRIDSTDFDHYQGQPDAYAKLITVFDGSQNLYGVPTAVYRCIVQKNSQGVVVPMHSSLDLLAAYRPGVFGAFAGTLCAVHPDDRDVMRNYLSLLLPKAVAYSSGLLDYYFRGKLAITNFVVTNSTQIYFTAQNISPQAFSGGSFRVFTDDASGNRTEATDLTTTYNPTTGLATNAAITGTFTFPSGASNGFTLFYCGIIGVDAHGNPLDTVDAGQAIAVTSTNIGAAVTFNLTYDDDNSEVDLYLTDPGGVTLYEADLAPQNGNTNSAYCISVGGDTGGDGGDGDVQNQVVTNMKDGQYQLWANLEWLNDAGPVHCTLTTSTGSGQVLSTESFTLTVGASGQYGHHGWPYGVTGPATLPSWYVRKAITIKNGNIVNY
jgi:hypothetical protein